MISGCYAYKRLEICKLEFRIVKKGVKYVRSRNQGTRF